MRLDPWLDAATIAERLQQPDTKLIIAIGAESWCGKCRELRPWFEAAARELDEAIWLWLDLEDHAEFIDGFIPDDIPLILKYTGPRLTHALVPRTETLTTLAEILNGVSRLEYGEAPDIRTRLTVVDWAN